MFLWYPVLDLARAPRRTARKKSSGYENASPCFVYPHHISDPHTNIPRDKSTPGGDTYNTRSERMQYSKYEREESHLSVPLFSGIKYLRFYSY